MEVRFGTDGVRGIANVELTAEVAVALGRAAGAVLSAHNESVRVVVGTDTRISCDMLEAALCAGLASAGANAIRCGVMPTPAVAALVRVLGATAGAVISASHNPPQYNGVKFFSSEGFKLPDEAEERIEEVVAGQEVAPKLPGPYTGRCEMLANGDERYIDYVLSHQTVDLSGRRLVIDCANGAAVRVAPALFERLGAEVVVLSGEPNGLNINEDCGALHPSVMQHAVREHQASAGMCFDGDADRVLMADETGRLLDGDRMMLLAARDLKTRGELANDLVVGTVMSNMGLEVALRADGIRLVRAPVGDRYVLEEMRRLQATIGGEQSGHLIFLNHTTTGDGIITALQVLSVALQSGQPLSQLAADMVEYPQVLKNVHVSGRDRWASVPEITGAVERQRQRLGDRGRILIRPSGTEPLLRIMVEGADRHLVDEIVAELSDLAHRHLRD